MANLREALDDLRKFLGINIDCDSLLLLYGASKKVGIDLNQFMLKLSRNQTLLKNFSAIIDAVVLPASEATANPVNTLFRINRSTPFDPVWLLGAKAGFWKGPKNGRGLEGNLEQDARSLALTELDLSTIQFNSYIPEGKTLITGENRLIAIKAEENDIPFDAQTGQALYEEEGQKSLRWLYDNRGIDWFECLGQTLRVAFGDRYSLVLYRLDDGSWNRYCGYLGGGRDASSPAAVVRK